MGVGRTLMHINNVVAVTVTSSRDGEAKINLPGFKQNAETGTMEKDTKAQTGRQLDDFFEALQKDERA